VFTVVDGDAGLGDIDLPAECSNPEPGDADFTLNDGENTTGVFDLGNDGARLIPLAVGTYTLTEVNPNDGTSDEFDVTAGETTTVIVFDFEAGEVEPGNPPTDGNGPDGEGTLGGNPTVPNTAMDLPVSPMSAVLALLMLSMLGVAGVAARAEVRRRR
jgi:hypothetical protein